MDDFVGLIFGCPSQSNHDTCPFNSFRKMEKAKAFELWEKLTKSEKQDLIEKHWNCTNSCKTFRKKILELQNLL